MRTCVGEGREDIYVGEGDEHIRLVGEEKDIRHVKMNGNKET